ncbi:MAG: NHL repeat-containing protein [Planctomycetota bacterium]|jgi:DNA-binding beta-propeller fold protein YncE
MAQKIVLAFLLCSLPLGEAMAEENQFTYKIEGGGVMIRWTVTKETEPHVHGFFLSIVDRSGKRFPQEAIPKTDRERFLPLWLKEGEEVRVGLIPKMPRVRFPGAVWPPLIITGPFKQIDAAAQGKVSDIQETSCGLEIELEGDKNAEVRVFDGPTLVGKVPSGETRARITGLNPGTRYALALIPFVQSGQDWLRGDRTLLPPFATLLASGWVPVNGGNRLNGDEPIAGGALRCGQSFSDKEGNLLFVIPSEELRAGMGRYNVQTKRWEVRGMEGWTDDHAVPVRGLHGHLDPSGGLFAMAECWTSSGKITLDTHGSFHHFRWDGNEWEQYAGGVAFSRYESRPLFCTFNGNGMGWGFAQNRKGIGLAVKVSQKSLNAKGRLIAVRLDPRDPRNRWSVWKDAKWQPHGYACSFIPDVAPPKNQEDLYPKVICVDGKNRWLVIFLRKPDGGRKPAFWTAVLYDDKSRKWHRWTRSGWRGNGELVPYPCGAPHEKTLKVLRERNGNLVFLWKNGPDFMRLEHRFGSKRGKRPEKLASIPPRGRHWAPFAFRATLTPEGKAMVVTCDHENNISVIGRGQVYKGLKNVRLCSIGFLDKQPVVFFIENEELKAVSPTAPAGEKVGKPGPLFAAEEKTPDPAVMEYLGSFHASVSDPNPPEGNPRPLPTAYQTQISGHMACGPDGTLFAPAFTTCHVCIYPPDHPEKPGVFWGGFWDYFKFPMGVAVDPKRGKVYFSHQITRGGCGGIWGGEVTIWDLKEKETFHWVRPGLRGKKRERAIQPERLQSDFLWPSGIVVDAGRSVLYVANSAACHVKRFDISGASPKPTGIFGEGNLDFPRGLACVAGGNVYVVDSRNHRVCVFDPEGKLVRAFGELGREPGRFLYPWGIAVDLRSGLVFVSDPQNARIQVFDKEGKFVTWWNHLEIRNLDGTPTTRPPPRPIQPGFPTPPRKPFIAPRADHRESLGLACDQRGFLYVSQRSFMAKFKITKK